jgi:hypothetical protein
MLQEEQERGYPLEGGEEADFLATRRVLLCGWCRLPEEQVHGEAQLQQALARVRAQQLAG